ncbi:MAG: hypothetical protein NC217_05640 [Muribaculaceae bacterium]|nr:hypothetical protein [Muribaculaceae bacterium]
MRHLPRPKTGQLILYLVLLVITIGLTFTLRLCRRQVAPHTSEPIVIQVDSTRYIPVDILR